MTERSTPSSEPEASARPYTDSALADKIEAAKHALDHMQDGEPEGLGPTESAFFDLMDESCGQIVAALRAVAQTSHEAQYRSVLEGIAGRVAKKAANGLRIICPVCAYKSVEPHTEARHAPNCAGELARAVLALTSTDGDIPPGAEHPVNYRKAFARPSTEGK